jgi:hypothetical protein
VLEGGRSLRLAFSGRATNVTLDSITVQNYDTGRQGGAIQPDAPASGWVVRNVSALHNYWAGLLVAGIGMSVRSPSATPTSTTPRVTSSSAATRSSRPPAG